MLINIKQITAQQRQHFEEQKTELHNATFVDADEGNITRIGCC